MLRLDLTPAQLEALRALRREPLAPAERDRVEMALLSVCGWSPPSLAEHFGYEVHAVRRILHAIAAEGAEAIAHKKPGKAPDLARRRQVETALKKRLREPRTWDAAQLQVALHDEGIDLSARQLQRYLGRMGARFRRTKPSLRHRQDPDERRRGRRQLARYRRLAQRGQIRLYFFDEAGFSPSQPTGRSWFLPGACREVPHESPQGHRVTALGAYAPYQRRRRLAFHVLGKRVRAADVLRAVKSLPHSRSKPTVVVLDNAPIHRSREIKDQHAAMVRSGLRLVSLPPYSPDMNPIEPVFGAIKSHEMPERTYLPRERLHEAVVKAFHAEARKLRRPRRGTKSEHPRRQHA